MSRIRIVAKVSINAHDYPGLTEEQILFCAELVAVETEDHLRSRYPGAEVSCYYSGHRTHVLDHLVTCGDRSLESLKMEIQEYLAPRQREWQQQVRGKLCLSTNIE